MKTADLKEPVNNETAARGGNTFKIKVNIFERLCIFAINCDFQYSE